MTHMRLFVAIASLAAVSTGQQQGLKVVNTGTAATTSSYVRVADSPSLEPSQFTFEMEIQPLGVGTGNTTDLGGAVLLAKPAEGSGGTYIFSWVMTYLPSTGQVRMSLTHTYNAQGVSVWSNGTIALGSTAHIATSFDGQSLKLFINGQLDNSVPFGFSGLYYGPEDVLIGAGNFCCGYLRRFDGIIDEVRIWDTALDQATIASRASCKLQGSEPGLLGYWDFDCGSLQDRSGHGHDGQLVGTAGSFVDSVTVDTPCGCTGTQSYCVTSQNSVGPGALISFCGSTRSADGTLSLGVSRCPTGVVGLFFFGSTQVQVPFGSGVRCAGGNIIRLSPTVLTTQEGTSSIPFDLQNPPAAFGVLAPGASLNFQFWYRDPPGPSSHGTNFSNGLQLTVCP